MPSTNKVAGARRRNDIIVIMEKRFMLSNDSCSEQANYMKICFQNIIINVKFLDQKNYLFLNHDFLAKHIARLEGYIRSHCAPESSPD